MNYDQYVDGKRIEVVASGFEPSDLNFRLFDYQTAITRWGIRRGKCAVFADPGLGKSIIEWEWGKHVAHKTCKPVLIFAPLSVSEQMIDEAPDFGYSLNLCETGNDLIPGLNVTNYEKLHKFEPDELGGIILDESGILKAGSFGKMSTSLVKFAASIPYRLAATATPAPNDLVEIAFHSEFLGIMREVEVKALFFTQDGNSSNKFRLKRNAVDKFYEWLATWAVALRMPSDLGFSDDGFQLPELNIHQVVIDSSEEFANGTLFVMEAKGISEQRTARRVSIPDRVRAVSDMVNSSDEQWLIWCDLNDESDELAKAIPDAIEVRGSSTPAHKVDAMRGFKAGRYRNVVSKPTIWGFGMNFQHSHNAAFCGLGNSFEQYFQTIKRQHRFGQKSPRVNVYVFVSAADGAVVQNTKRKWQHHDEMFSELVKHMAVHADLGQQIRNEMDYNPQQTVTIPAWMRKPKTAKTEPGRPWIDLDDIPYQIDGEIKNFWDGLTGPNLSEPMIVPQWVSTILCNP